MDNLNGAIRIKRIIKLIISLAVLITPYFITLAYEYFTNQLIANGVMDHWCKGIIIMFMVIVIISAFMFVLAAVFALIDYILDID